jgi:hypothetical protein
VEHFPTDFDSSFETSFEIKLLPKLSAFLYFATPPNDVDYNVLRDHFQTVKLAPEALQTLSAITSSSKEEGQPSESSFNKSKAKSQKQKARHTHDQECNTRPLVDLNIAIPRTSSDAQATLTLFLGRLRNILEVCSW